MIFIILEHSELKLGAQYISEMSGGQWCDLCKVYLSSKALIDMHDNGKRHHKKVVERDALLALAARSVFISGLDPEIIVTESEVSFSYFLVIVPL